ncbi:hypothetical protein V2J09_013671 [Rumex salicifolius]
MQETLICVQWQDSSSQFFTPMMERLDLRNFTDQIKELGILVAVLGAFVVTLYKGPTLLGLTIRVIGPTAIIVGFYAVMWGQAKTTKMTVSMAMDNKIGGLESGSSTSHVTPLCCTAQNLIESRILIC